MPWKIGGNFEAAAVTCETDWQECVITVANYLWGEMVSDVVEYFAKDGIIWVLAIAIASMMLIRVKYHRNMQVENIVLNKQMLSKIEYKIGDLELKVNVLTYKVQYGTWPLPHRIFNWNPKKLRKIRMTLSNPGDRNDWIKHVLLSPAESNMYTLHSNTFTPRTKLPKFFDIKQKHIPHRLQCDKLSTNCSSIEISKSISDRSVKMCSRRPRDPRPQSVNTKGSNSLSNSEDFTSQHRYVKIPSMPDEMPDEINRRSLKLPSRQSGKCAMYSTNAKYNSSRQKVTDTVYKCKSFFKNLKYKKNYSQRASEAVPLKTTRAKEFASLTTERRNKSSSGLETTKGKEINDGKCITKIKDRRKNKFANVNSDENAFPRKLVPPIFPIIRAAHIVRSSRETLYKVRKRLHSLHNILQTYQHVTQSSKKQKSMKQIDEISDTSTPVESKTHGIEETDENKTNTNRNSDSKENSRRVQSCRSITNSSENFELDRLEGSLSTFVEYSSNTSETYRCSSDVASHNTYSKRDSQHNTTQKSVDTSDLPVFTEPYNYQQYSSRFYGAMSQIPKDKTERKEDARKYISNRNNNHRSCSNKNMVKTNILFNLKENVPEVMSKKICYVLSPELFKDKNAKTQNETFLMKKFDALDAKQSAESVISQNSSRSEMPSNSEAKEKSIALLLQEALHFKKTLLTRSREKCAMSSVKQIDVADELPECETQIKNNHFPSMILDIKTKEPIASYSHNEINQCYIALQMKQRRDLSSQNGNTYRRRDTEEQNCISKIPSEYFSIADLAIYKNDNIENNALLPSTPPIYEKMISITMPNDRTKNQNNIETSKKSIQRKAMLTSIPNHVKSDDLGENTGTIHNNIIDKYLSILKLEDLILEQVQNIKGYVGIFLQNQNGTISKTCKELQCQSESDAFLCSNKQNHVVLYNRSIASSSCNDIDRVASFSKGLPDLSMNTWLNYKNDIKERNSDTRLKKALIAPIQDTLSDENDAQLERKETDLSLPIDSTSTPTVTGCETLCSKEHITPDTKNDTLNKQATADANFQKHGKQTQTVGNEFSISNIVLPTW